MRFPEGQPIPRIISTGEHFGRMAMSNEHVAQKIGTSAKAADRLAQGVGIETRHWVEPGTPVSDLAAAALIMAINMARLTPQDIDALLLATSSPDILAANVSAIVAGKVGLRKNIFGTVNVDACSGWGLAMELAVDRLLSPRNSNTKVAVVAGDVVSAFLDPKDRGTTLLFGDAVAACILGNGVPPSNELSFWGFSHGVDSGENEEFSEALGIYRSGSLDPSQEGTLENGLHGLHMEGDKVKYNAVLRISQAIKEAAADADLPLEEVDHFIPHQANKQIMDAVAENLGLKNDSRFISTINHMGNTSAASIPTALHQNIMRGKIKRGSKIIAAAFGGGFSWTGVAFSY